MFKKTLTVSMVLLLCMVIAPQQVEAFGLHQGTIPDLPINSNQSFRAFVFCCYTLGVFMLKYLVTDIINMVLSNQTPSH